VALKGFFRAESGQSLPELSFGVSPIRGSEAAAEQTPAAEEASPEAKAGGAAAAGAGEEAGRAEAAALSPQQEAPLSSRKPSVEGNTAAGRLGAGPTDSPRTALRPASVPNPLHSPVRQNSRDLDRIRTAKSFDILHTNPNPSATSAVPLPAPSPQTTDDDADAAAYYNMKVWCLHNPYAEIFPS
jgi:hypothetical protein